MRYALYITRVCTQFWLVPCQKNEKSIHYENYALWPDTLWDVLYHQGFLHVTLAYKLTIYLRSHLATISYAHLTKHCEWQTTNIGSRVTTAFIWTWPVPDAVCLVKLNLIVQTLRVGLKIFQTLAQLLMSFITVALMTKAIPVPLVKRAQLTTLMEEPRRTGLDVMLAKHGFIGAVLVTVRTWTLSINGA